MLPLQLPLCTDGCRIYFYVVCSSRVVSECARCQSSDVCDSVQWVAVTTQRNKVKNALDLLRIFSTARPFFGRRLMFFALKLSRPLLLHRIIVYLNIYCPCSQQPAFCCSQGLAGCLVGFVTAKSVDGVERVIFRVMGPLFYSFGEF